MSKISMKALLESGVHFGHRTNKWDPRMKPYIFTERNGIHILDLQQTVKLANNAYQVIRDTVANGGTVLFVGTKRQAQETVMEEATRAGMPYVTERWMGGTLSNWSTMYQRIQELERLEKLRDSGDIDHLTKKEGLLIEREITRLQTRLSGLRSMKRIPDLLFIVDVGHEDAAVTEANHLNIPIVALVDTNCNPQNIDYVIPSNDDAIRAIKLLVSKMADAAIEGKGMQINQDTTSDNYSPNIQLRLQSEYIIKTNLLIQKQLGKDEKWKSINTNIWRYFLNNKDFKLGLSTMREIASKLEVSIDDVLSVVSLLTHHNKGFLQQTFYRYSSSGEIQFLSKTEIAQKMRQRYFENSVHLQEWELWANKVYMGWELLDENSIKKALPSESSQKMNSSSTDENVPEIKLNKTIN